MSGLHRTLWNKFVPPTLHVARRAHGFSIMELTIVLTVMGVLVAMAAPTFQVALEQSRADVAGANLRAIWSAQRLYWLESQTYSTDLSQLQSLGILDSQAISASTVYAYTIDEADAGAFRASATRIGTTRWSGALTIDQTGTTAGSINSSSSASIEPAFQ